MKSILSLLLLASCLIYSGCTSKHSDNRSLSDPLITHRDTTIDPATDFFYYANGEWFKMNPIPASESSNGIFNLVRDTVNAQIRRICESSATDKKAEKNSNKQKIGDFYASGLDTVSINAAGLDPLKSAMQKINAITDRISLISAITYLHTIGVTPAFSFYVRQDDKISSSYAVCFAQGGIGLDDRDYYFNTDSLTTLIRSEYREHLKAMFKLIGKDEKTASANADIVMKIETDFAKASRKLEALRDPVKNYNKYSIEGVKTFTPGIPWKDMLTGLGIEAADSVIIGQPEFFKAFDVLLANYTISDWKTYLEWNLVNSYAENLSKEFEQQNFNFYYTTLSGMTEQQPRWKRITRSTNWYLGELIGQVYIKEYLPEKTKEKLLEIGNNIRNVFAERLKNLDWMSESTREKAMLKLNKMVMKVGYPDTWKDMNSLAITRNSYCENVIRCRQWQYSDMISHYRKPVDRMEWFIYPQTYNAYYSPGNNEIVIPACNIIVPGFEGRMPDDAVLYAIIGGSTFGHEIIHGFDDQGSLYDENGNLIDWWTEGDRQRFNEKTRLIIEQYSAYTVLDSLHLNGDATQGENIADLAGVILGYEAFKKTAQYKENQMKSGLTPDERYFLSYAFAWMVNITNESLARQIMTDVHSPAQFRINGPLSNLPEFYKTFNVKAGDIMYRPDSMRVDIW
jgi:putative endopeptidase